MLPQICVSFLVSLCDGLLAFSVATNVFLLFYVMREIVEVDHALDGWILRHGASRRLVKEQNDWFQRKNKREFPSIEKWDNFPLKREGQ